MKNLIKIEDLTKEEIISKMRRNINLMKMHTSDYKILIDDKDFIVKPNVFSPKYCDGTCFFVNHLPVSSGDKFLEIGGGTGAVSIILKLKGASKVVCTDISPDSITNINENIKLHNLTNSISVIESDLFQNIHEKFDKIFWNIPFSDASPENLLEKSIFDDNYQKVKEFIFNSKEYLNLGGRVFIGFSKTLGDFNKILKIVNEINAEIKEISKVIIGNDYKKETLEIEYNLFEIIYN